MQIPGEAELPDADADVFADARDVLNYLRFLQLAPARWDRVEEILDSFLAALAAGNLTALREAVAELELVGPVRITPVGATPVVPAPPPVRERVNHLVYSLSDYAGNTMADRVGGGRGQGDNSARSPTH